MLSDEWLPRYRLLENFTAKWNGNGNGNAYDRGDYNSSFALRAVELKMKALECSQDFSHYKSMGIFPDAQGQLTPQSLVRSGRISNSFEMLWMSSLPASMNKIQSKRKALEWSQHNTAIFQTRKGR